MRHIATILFVLVGLVNFVPIVGVLGAAKLEALYGVPIGNDDVLLLLRHRAVLFGLLGALLIHSAFRIEWRALATAAGLASMGAYLLLAWPIAVHGAAVQKVFLGGRHRIRAPDRGVPEFPEQPRAEVVNFEVTGAR